MMENDGPGEAMYCKLLWVCVCVKTDEFINVNVGSSHYPFNPSYFDVNKRAIRF